MARIQLFIGNYEIMYNIIIYFQCVNVSLEGEVLLTEAPLEKREKDMVGLMQDEDLRSAAEHLFRRMSVIPASRYINIIYLIIYKIVCLFQCLYFNHA